MRTYSRRGALGFGLVALAAVCGGCQNNDIPLVKFPEGVPPPPESKQESGGPQGINTSKGEPAH